MINIDIKGINSVGRMYRPQSVVNSENRGMKLPTKYKSNFGGEINKLEIEINLEYSIKDKTEVLVLDIKQIDKTIDLAVSKEKYDRVSKNKVKGKQKIIKINTCRSLIKLDAYNLKQQSKDKPILLKLVNGILYLDLFIDSKEKKEQDKAYIAIYPTVIEYKEYLFIEYDSDTPILIRCNSNIALY